MIFSIRCIILTFSALSEVKMFYSISLDKLPKITDAYTVVRNTVWQIADNDNILILVREGCCRIETDGERHELSAGDVIFIPANRPYTRTPSGSSLCTLSYIHFALSEQALHIDEKELYEKVTEMKNSLDIDILSGNASPEYSNTVFLRTKCSPECFEEIVKATGGIKLFGAKRDLTTPLESKLKLLGILSMLYADTLKSLLTDISLRTGTSVPDNLKKASEYIARHYKENISLEDLAAYCSVSKQQMIRYFKQNLGVTPVTYITNYKLARAKEMLFKYPLLTVKEIAANLGFDNQHYFSRVFAKVCGETPSQYRYRTVHYNELENGKK